MTFEIKNPIENGFYKLTFDCLAAANGFVQVDQVDYYIDDSKTSTTISFGSNSNKTFTFTEGKLEGFSAPTATETTGVAGTIAYSSDNTAAISVDASTGALTFNGYGKATITATFTPNDTKKYAESTDSYIVENKAESINAAFYESFNNCDGKAGWSGSVADKPWDAEVFDNSGWTKTGKAYLGAECIRIGKDASSVITPVISLTGDAILTFMAGAWNKDNTTITVSVSDGTLTYGDNAPAKSVNIDLVQSTWVTYSMKISGTKSCKITFNNKTTSYRFFLDEVMVKNVSESGETTNITLDENSESNTIEAKTGVNVTLKRSMVANEWNTICLPFDVTMDKAKAAFGDNVKIVELDTKAAVDANVLSFKASTGIVAATPYLIKPSAVADEYTFENVDITNKAADYSTTANVDVAFKGIYNMVDITKNVVESGDTYYAAFLGADNKIYKAKANGNKTKGFRAYFAIPNGAAASALRVVIDGTATSIKNIDSEVVESNAPVYNLQGQRVNGNNLTPGIYVKAGKKFVVK
ncbi:hypothetical protein [uncultured Prevotella sp.]|uniref:hypothetical protein n=1 Tax=uncultured Prevotella sp. TaxID=159272 RepID=UPI0027E31897|nr:hypothetical protein [uncultured Prevotella sp.]